MGSRTRNFANNVNANGRPINVDVTEFDDNKIVNDLSTLGLRVHTQENLSASNTNSQYVDVFQDSTGFTNGANCERNDSEFVSSVTSGALTGSFTDMSSSNFAAASSWTISGNNLTMGTSPDTDDGSNTGRGSSTITFGANRPFQFLAGPTYETTGYGPYWGFCKTSSDVIRGIQCEAVGEFYFKHGSNAGSPGIYASDGGSSAEKIGNNMGSGTYVGVERTGAGIFKLHFSSSNNISFDNANNTLKYTFTNAYLANAYYFVVSGQGAHRSDLDNMRYDLGTETSAAATGNFTCPAITAASSTSKMGAVITYQDNAGTNVLNTDIILQLSADNGSNFSTATLTALPDFSSGIKMAKVNDLPVTAGTQLKYKISFANQAAGSKEARIRGVSLNY